MIATRNQGDKKQDIAIAEMARDITYIKDSIHKIDSRLDIMDSNYVKREEFEIYRASDSKKKEEHDEKIRAIELNNATFQSRVTTWGTIALILLGVAQFVIGKYL